MKQRTMKGTIAPWLYMCILSNQKKNLTIPATEELFSSALCYPRIYQLEILFN